MLYVLLVIFCCVEIMSTEKKNPTKGRGFLL